MVGWFSLLDYYGEATAERCLEPCVAQFTAVIAGEQLTTLRGI